MRRSRPRCRSRRWTLRRPRCRSRHSRRSRPRCLKRHLCPSRPTPRSLPSRPHCLATAGARAGIHALARMPARPRGRGAAARAATTRARRRARGPGRCPAAHSRPPELPGELGVWSVPELHEAKTMAVATATGKAAKMRTLNPPHRQWHRVMKSFFRGPPSTGSTTPDFCRTAQRAGTPTSRCRPRPSPSTASTHLVPPTVEVAAAAATSISVFAPGGTTNRPTRRPPRWREASGLGAER